MPAANRCHIRRHCPGQRRWRKTVVGVTLAVLCVLPEAYAEDRGEVENAPAEQSNAGLRPPSDFLAAQETPDAVTVSEETRRFRTRMVLWSAPLGVAVYGAANWWGSDMVSFHTVSEGWFGQDTYSGGADKLGHGFSAYLGMRVATWALDWAGNDHDDSVRMASVLSLATFMAIEVFDGFTEQYGFSSEDAIVSIAGIGLGYALERHPAVDDVIDFRVRYWRSDDAKRLNEMDPISDYSGQTFFLVAKAAGFPALRRSQWTRYLELAVGYGTRGYEPNDGTPVDPHRLLFVGISLNLSEILNDTVFRKHRGSGTQRVTDGVLEFFQVPGTGAYADHRL